MDKPVPVILITGWLGSGKTTLLNHLLGAQTIRDARPALVINEFGLIGVDGRLIDGRGRPVLEINKGSLFCICTKLDFVRVMQEIRQMPDVGMVLVEATGVAEAVDLASLLDVDVLEEAFYVSAVICVIDAAAFVKTAAFSRAAASQARAADLLVINKTDLVDEATLKQLLNLLFDMNPAAKVVAVSRGEMPPSALNSLTHKNHPAGTIATAPPRDIVSVSIRDPRAIDRGRWERVIESLGERLLRLKGNVHFAGEGPGDAPRTRLVEISVSGRDEREALNGLGDPAGSNQPSTAFTAIAWQMSEEQLRAQFEEAFNPPGG